jgi:hypothetical protein
LNTSPQPANPSRNIAAQAWPERNLATIFFRQVIALRDLGQTTFLALLVAERPRAKFEYSPLPWSAVSLAR